MGLGPPVCEKCNVIGSLYNEAEWIAAGRPTKGDIRPYWGCPLCGSKSLNENYFTCNIAPKVLEQNLEAGLRLKHFADEWNRLLGEMNASIDRKS